MLLLVCLCRTGALEAQVGSEEQLVQVMHTGLAARTVAGAPGDAGMVAYLSGGPCQCVCWSVLFACSSVHWQWVQIANANQMP